MAALHDRIAAAIASLPADESAHARDLATAAEAALLGGRAVLRHYRSGNLAVDEAGRGPVTDADRDSHAIIVHYLRESRPEDGILSEESAADVAVGSSIRLWIVDPLDGTREFIDRIGEFSVMVGLAVEGQAVLGAVYRPDPGVLYLGLANRVCWRLEEAAPGNGLRRLPPTRSSSDGLRLVRSRSHPDERLKRLESALEPTAVILSGSVGVKCGLISEDGADLYVHPVPYLMEWDTCAPEAILRGAGGRVTDCAGRSLGYGKPDPAQSRGIFAAGTADLWTRFAPCVLSTCRDLDDDANG